MDRADRQSVSEHDDVIRGGPHEHSFGWRGLNDRPLCWCGLREEEVASGENEVGITCLRADNTRLRETLATLRAWDMLTLDKDGHGVATADAPWAVALIDAALANESQETE